MSLFGGRRGLGSLLLGAALAASTLTGCSSTAGAAPPAPTPVGGPRDLVGWLVDDGSLRAGLSDADPERRWLAARGLARLPPLKPPAPVVSALAVEPDPKVLAELCFTLGRWREATAREALRRTSGHPSEQVRVAAYDALSRLMDDRVTTYLVQGLQDPKASVRGAAALGLARLDSRRSDHERRATSAQRDARDESLTLLAIDDPDAGVRWRATYALASVRPRKAHAAALRACLDEPDEPLVVAFALRGLTTLGREGMAQPLAAARPLVADPSSLISTEATRLVAALGSYQEVLELALTQPWPGARVLAWEGLPEARARARQWALANSAGTDAIAAADAVMLAGATAELSPWVRRAALLAEVRLVPALETALGDDWRQQVEPLLEVERGRSDVAGKALISLARSLDRRDREAAAALLADGTLRDYDLLDTFLSDPEPAVRAAALPALSSERLSSLWPRLREALESDDVALIGQAGTTSKPLVESGRAPPWLLTGLAEALERTSVDPSLEEARLELAAALGLPPLDPVPPAQPLNGSILDELVRQQSLAQQDPSPRLQLVTDRGTLVLELDRLLAPRHVENVLELAAIGSYDGLQLHRVVPDFVVQGLDPRGDGWGSAGRRVPDEFSPAPFLSGTLGMPRVQRPHTGGCQIFITHLPTPHLDGEYTVFGRVVQGLELLPLLEVGDLVHRVTRVDG